MKRLFQNMNNELKIDGKRFQLFKSWKPWLANNPAAGTPALKLIPSLLRFEAMTLCFYTIPGSPHTQDLKINISIFNYKLWIPEEIF